MPLAASDFPTTPARHHSRDRDQFHEITGDAYLSSEPVSLLFIQLAFKQIMLHRLLRGFAFARRIILEVEPMEVLVFEGAVSLDCSIILVAYIRGAR